MKKILILLASPQDKDTPPLELARELHQVETALERALDLDQFELLIRWAARVEDLRRELLHEKPQIVHFSGHGAGSYGLVLETDSRQKQFVSTEALAGLFELCKNYVECVLLNACYSEEQAIAIHRHINYVIGMNQAILDRAAIEFAIGFYDALAAGRSYRDAYRVGCNAIDLMGIKDSENKSESLIPVLKARRYRGDKGQIPGNNNVPIETSSGIETRRRLEAAMPQQSKVGRPTEVRAMVALYDSLGLRAYLPDYTESGELIEKNDVVDNDVPLEFPLDPSTQKPQPVELFISITAPGFAVEKSIKSIHVSPKHESGIITFFLTPIVCQKYARIIVEWFKEEERRTLIGSLTLITEVFGTQDELLKVIWSVTKLTLNSVNFRRRGSTKGERGEPLVAPETPSDREEGDRAPTKTERDLKVLPDQSISITGSTVSGSIGQAGRDLVQMHYNQGTSEKQLTVTDVVGLIMQIETLLKDTALPDNLESRAMTHLEAAKDATQEEEPDKDYAAKSLQKATKIIKEASETMESGQKLWNKVEPILKQLLPWLGVATHFFGL